jgi:O-antigen ligase
MLVGVLIRFLLVRSKESSAFTQALLLVAVVGITAAPMLVSDRLGGVTQQLQSSTERVLQGADTTGSRFNNWKATLSLWANGGPTTLAIGKIFGADTTRYIEDEKRGSIKIQFYAHNLYVQNLYNTGLIGFTAFLAALAYVIRGLYRLNRSGVDGIETQVLMVLMVMQMAYYVPYGTDYLQSLLFGVALSFVATRLPKAAPAAAALRTQVRGT